MFNPEAIEVALFNLLQAAVKGLPFKTVARHGRIWGNIDPQIQPALFLIPLGGPTDQPGPYGLPRYTLHYLVLIYARADGANVPTNQPNTPAPQTILNNAWAAVQKALLGSQIGQPQTLGGLVTNCWIEGEVTMQAGILDAQMALEIPVRALTAI
jgi:hypothetical protein